MGESQNLTLTIRLRRESLDFVISNRGAESVRVWELNNRWGWETTALDIAPASRPEESFTLRPRPQIWTKNFPSHVEIPAGGRHALTLRPGDPEWEGLDRVEHLRTERLRVSGRLQIPTSPEALEQDVFVGEVSGPPVESDPPHAWLFRAP